MTPNDDALLAEFVRDLRMAERSPATIQKRIELVQRFRRWLVDRGRSLTDATADDCRAFQMTFLPLAVASRNIYSRHLRAFYAWALLRGFRDGDPTVALIVPRTTRGLPHPIGAEDLRLIFVAANSELRLAFALAAFGGLRRSEICALQRGDVRLGDHSSILVHGKGRKERIVPLLPPIVNELYRYGLPRAGYLLTYNGLPYDPDLLSTHVRRLLRRIGVETTLHSARHSYATNVATFTHDPLLVRDLLGHESVATSEIYMDSTLTGAHARLGGLAALAVDVLGHSQPASGLRLIRGGRA